MTRLERREKAMRQHMRKLGKKAGAVTSEAKQPKTQKKKCRPDDLEFESLPVTPLEVHHHISSSRNNFTNMISFLSENQGDPAIKVRASILKVISCIYNYLPSNRTSDRNWRSTSWLVFITPHGLEMETSTLRRKDSASSS